MTSATCDWRKIPYDINEEIGGKFKDLLRISQRQKTKNRTRRKEFVYRCSA